MGRDLEYTEDPDAHYDENYGEDYDDARYDDDRYYDEYDDEYDDGEVGDDYDEEFWEDDDRPSPRERWLKLALLAIAAGLAATIVSLISQRSNDDADDVSTESGQTADLTTDESPNGDGATSTTPSTAATNATAAGATPDAATSDDQPAAVPGAGPPSGTVTIDIDALSDTGGRAVDIVTRFNGGDYATTIAFIDDPETYSGSPEIEELRSVDGAYYHRATVDGDWQPAADPSAVSLDEGIALPPIVVGWTSTGIDELIAAAGITPAADGQAATGTITVGQARSLPALPAGVAVIAGDEWDWADEQPISVSVTYVDGQVSELNAEASDGDTDRPSGPVTVTALTSFTEVGAGGPIEVPS